MAGLHWRWVAELFFVRHSLKWPMKRLGKAILFGGCLCATAIFGSTPRLTAGEKQTGIKLLAAVQGAEISAERYFPKPHAREYTMEIKRNGQVLDSGTINEKVDG